MTYKSYRSRHIKLLPFLPVASNWPKLAHRGGDLPWPSTTSLSVASISAEEKNSPLPDSCLPLPGCNNPKYCVGGLPHVTFSAPGGATPTREEIEWVTRR